jgi:hypothetical protein
MSEGIRRGTLDEKCKDIPGSTSLMLMRRVIDKDGRGKLDSDCVIEDA